MITLKKYNQDYRSIWNEFVDKSKNGLFMFDRNFMEYHSDRYQDNSLMFFEDDDLIAVLPLSVHGNELRSHGGLTYGGFITNENMKQQKMLKCFELLKEYMSSHGFSQLLYKTIPYIYHKYPADEDLYALFRHEANIFKIEPATVIDLTRRYKISKGHKALISRAKREGATIEISDDFETFIALENEVLLAKHNTVAVHNADELKLLRGRFPNGIQLVVTKHNGIMIAACLLFVYDNAVHTQYLAANEFARSIGGLSLLIKTIIDRFSGEKQYLDFGISTENNGFFLNEGLIDQKQYFGGRTVAYITWKLIQS